MHLPDGAVRALSGFLLGVVAGVILRGFALLPGTRALLLSLTVCALISLPFAYARRDTPLVIPVAYYKYHQQ
jgi:hypothetical protein